MCHYIKDVTLCFPTLKVSVFNEDWDSRGYTETTVPLSNSFRRGSFGQVVSPSSSSVYEIQTDAHFFCTFATRVYKPLTLLLRKGGFQGHYDSVF